MDLLDSIHKKAIFFCVGDFGNNTLPIPPVEPTAKALELENWPWSRKPMLTVLTNTLRQHHQGCQTPSNRP
jgi:hypothetical protein